ncbi:MAG: glycosyltransferase family 2 protein [Bacteroidia bacterium]|nr:glycosyltransferase family 2 protein [Bacteroidia bacterium]
MIHVVIVSYCEWEALEPTISDFLNVQDVDIQIHVADNLEAVSVQRQVELLPAVSYKSFSNVGYGQAFNLYVAELQLMESDLLIVSNDDVRIQPDALKKLVDGYQTARKHIGKIGPVSPSYSANGNDMNHFAEGKIKLDSGVSTVAFSPAALWLMDHDFLVHVGGFVPNFFLYAEDRELCYRSLYYGYQPILVEDATVEHEFRYPPTHKANRIELECNTISAQFLNPSESKMQASQFALKSLISALLRLDFKRFSFVWKGYGLFRKRRKSLLVVKQKILDKELKFRFLTTQ